MPVVFTQKCLFIFLLLAGILFIYIWSRNSCKSTSEMRGTTRNTVTDEQSPDLEGRSKNVHLEGEISSQVKMEWEKKKKETKELLAELDQLMPRVTFSDIKETTSAKNSKATILNHKDAYCVGEHLMVRLDLYDHAGKRKTYGGDFLRARIYSPSLKAGASGSIQDFKNGTYLVNFTLFWEGDVRTSIWLIHPSEGVSALWAARKKGYDKIAFTGKFLNGLSEMSTECGFNQRGNAELCKYLDERDQEAFYCLKPKDVPCEAFIRLQSFTKGISYLTALEQRLCNRSNIGSEFLQMIGDIRVLQCENNQTETREKCGFEMSPLFPTGFVWQDRWHPLFCKMSSFTLEQIQTCLKGKLVYLLGDSTVRQWMEMLKNKLPDLSYLDLHVRKGKSTKLTAISPARNILIQWEKHGHPFIGSHDYSIKDHAYLARVIDSISGDQDTALVVSLGQHFRPFPLDLFILRAINVRRAIQRLLQRSPDTKVIIKGENVREKDIDQEQFSDFHGYMQYLAAKAIFRGLNVAFIDAWDMTVAYDTQKVHPQESVVWSQINMFLNYVC